MCRGTVIFGCGSVQFFIFTATEHHKLGKSMLHGVCDGQGCMRPTSLFYGAIPHPCGQCQNCKAMGPAEAVRGYQAHLKANNSGEAAGHDAVSGDDQQARGEGQESKKLALEFKGMLERYVEAHVKRLVLEEKVKSLEGEKEHWREMVIRLADRLLSGLEESLPVIEIEGNGEAEEEED